MKKGRALLVAEKKRFLKASQKIKSEEAPLTLLAAGIAHEFHNLLGAADGHAQWALESGDPKDMKEALEIVRLVCTRSSQITRALQSFSQPREEEQALIRLNELFTEVAKIYSTLCSEQGIKLLIKETKLELKINKLDLEEVLVNLIKNALEALSNQSGEKVISVEAEKNGKTLIINVKDNGPGVLKIHREHIFKPFWTTKGVLKNLQKSTEKVSSSKQDGSGLGLYISRMRILERGGDLRLKATSKGCHFVIEIPL
ncbi:MAG: GHKL domain-containing protein [Proteobacteria bacterium]|nr:GHKL domain-containing protein [Pseudomonadota bacterium]